MSLSWRVERRAPKPARIPWRCASAAAPPARGWPSWTTRVLLVREPRIAAAAIAALPRLRGIVRYGIGVDGIDLAAAVQAVRMLRGEPPLHWLNRWTTEEGTLQ